MLRNKYGAKKVKTEEGTFDSKKEYKRWLELKQMAENGLITDLERQVKYELIPSQKGIERNEKPCYYIADFVYHRCSKQIVEDVKGQRKGSAGWSMYVIKRKLMKQVYDIEIIEV